MGLGAGAGAPVDTPTSARAGGKETEHHHRERTRRHFYSDAAQLQAEAAQVGVALLGDLPIDDRQDPLLGNHWVDGGRERCHSLIAFERSWESGLEVTGGDGPSRLALSDRRCSHGAVLIRWFEGPVVSVQDDEVGPAVTSALSTAPG